jgi:hypothetical protein
MVASVCLSLALCGCGFTTGASAGPPQNVDVSVSPPSASVSLGQMVQFVATVTGTSSPAVNWSVNNVAGGNSSVGTISASGLYTAREMMPSVSSVTVTATTQAEPQASGSATVQIQSSIVVSIAPASASIAPGGAANFTATVSGTGTGSSAVTWSVNGISGGTRRWARSVSLGQTRRRTPRRQFLPLRVSFGDRDERRGLIGERGGKRNDFVRGRKFRIARLGDPYGGRNAEFYGLPVRRTGHPYYVGGGRDQGR